MLEVSGHLRALPALPVTRVLPSLLDDLLEGDVGRLRPQYYPLLPLLRRCDREGDQPTCRRPYEPQRAGALGLDLPEPADDDPQPVLRLLRRRVPTAHLRHGKPTRLCIGVHKGTVEVDKKKSGNAAAHRGQL